MCAEGLCWRASTRDTSPLSCPRPAGGTRLRARGGVHCTGRASERLIQTRTGKELRICQSIRPALITAASRFDFRKLGTRWTLLLMPRAGRSSLGAAVRGSRAGLRWHDSWSWRRSFRAVFRPWCFFASHACMTARRRYAIGRCLPGYAPHLFALW